MHVNMAAGFGATMPPGKSFVLVILMFGAGILFGFTFAYYYVLQTNYSPINLKPSELLSKYLRYLPSRELSKSKAGADSNKALRTTSLVSSHPLDAHTEADAKPQILANQVRVLCWVMTSPSNHDTKATDVKNTWGKRCDKLIFMSSKSDEKLGAVGLPNVQEGRDWLWAKTKEAFKYVWEHHRDEADWFMKADDDTFVILENLRYMLSEVEPRSPIYFGCRFRHQNHDYMSGGAGYVLSREALRRFVEQALPDGRKCNQSHEGDEDLQIGRCLEAVGVTAGDSRDIFGRYRFLPFTPESHVIPRLVHSVPWYWKRIYYPQREGMDCCSEMAISFHYISPEQMHAMEYLIYHLRLFGEAAHKQLKTEPMESANKSALNIPETGKALERGNATIVSDKFSGGNISAEATSQQRI